MLQDQAVEHREPRRPVVRIPFEDPSLGLPVLLEEVRPRAGGDDLLEVTLIRVERLLRVHDHRLIGEQLQEVGSGLRQGDPNRHVVGLLDAAHGREQRLIRANDPALRIHDPAQRSDNIVRRERRAVGKLDAAAQLKSVDLLVGRNIELLGEIRDDRPQAVAKVPSDQIAVHMRHRRRRPALVDVKVGGRHAEGELRLAAPFRIRLRRLHHAVLARRRCRAGEGGRIRLGRGWRGGGLGRLDRLRRGWRSGGWRSRGRLRRGWRRLSRLRGSWRRLGRLRDSWRRRGRLRYLGWLRRNRGRTWRRCACGQKGHAARGRDPT